MERIKLTGEYLDLLGKYNSAAREFSRMVKPLQDTGKRMEAEFNDEYWKNYEKSRDVALVKMNELKNFEFKYEPFRPLQPEFVTFVEKMERYIALVEENRGSVTKWTPERKKSFYATLDPLYGEILKQSKQITEKIDRIYNRVFVTGENG